MRRAYSKSCLSHQTSFFSLADSATLGEIISKTKATFAVAL
jgi:hypothetical protein